MCYTKKHFGVLAGWTRKKIKQLMTLQLRDDTYVNQLKFKL